MLEGNKSKGIDMGTAWAKPRVMRDTKDAVATPTYKKMADGYGFVCHCFFPNA